MAFGTPVAGAVAYSASTGITVSPAYPAGILATDAVILVVGQKPASAGAGGVVTPTGWTLQESIFGAGYGSTLGADTGSTRLRIYSWNAPIAGQTGTSSVTLSSNSISWAFIVRIPTGGGTLSYGTADAEQLSTPGTTLSLPLTDGTSPTALQAGDLALWAMCIPTDVSTPSQFSNHSVTATGTTFGTAVELNEPDTSTGLDIGGYSAYAIATAGSSTTAPTVSTTVGGTRTNVRGPIALIRIREESPSSVVHDVSIDETGTVDEASSPSLEVDSSAAENVAVSDSSNADALSVIAGVATEAISALDSSDSVVIENAACTESVTSGHDQTSQLDAVTSRTETTTALDAQDGASLRYADTTETVASSDSSGGSLTQAVSVIGNASTGLPIGYIGSPNVSSPIANDASGRKANGAAFIATSNYTLKYVNLNLGKTKLNPTPSAGTIEVWTTTGFPSTATLGSLVGSVSVPFNKLVDGLASYDLSPANITLTAGQQYVLLLRAGASWNTFSDYISFKLGAPKDYNVTGVKWVYIDNSDVYTLDSSYAPIISFTDTPLALEVQDQAYLSNAASSESVTLADVNSLSGYVSSAWITDSTNITYVDTRSGYSAVGNALNNAVGSTGSGYGFVFIPKYTGQVGQVTVHGGWNQSGNPKPIEPLKITLWNVNQSTNNPTTELASVFINVNKLPIAFGNLRIIADFSGVVQAQFIDFTKYALTVEAGSDWDSNVTDSFSILLCDQSTGRNYVNSAYSGVGLIKSVGSSVFTTTINYSLLVTIEGVDTTLDVGLGGFTTASDITETVTTTDSADNVINKTYEVDITEYDDATDFTRAYGPYGATEVVVEELYAQDSPGVIRAIYGFAPEDSVAAQFYYPPAFIGSGTTIIASSTTVYSQPFLPESFGLLGQIELRGYRSSTANPLPTVNGAVEIWTAGLTQLPDVLLGTVSFDLSKFGSSVSGTSVLYDFSSLGIYLAAGTTYCLVLRPGSDWSSATTQTFGITVTSASSATTISWANQLNLQPRPSNSTNSGLTFNGATYRLPFNAYYQAAIDQQATGPVVTADITESGTFTDSLDGTLLDVNKVFESVTPSDSSTRLRTANGYASSNELWDFGSYSFGGGGNTLNTANRAVGNSFIAQSTQRILGFTAQVTRSNTGSPLPAQPGTIELWQLATNSLTAQPNTLIASSTFDLSPIASTTNYFNFVFSDSANATVVEGTAYAILVRAGSDWSLTTQYLSLLADTVSTARSLTFAPFFRQIIGTTTPYTISVVISSPFIKKAFYQAQDVLSGGFEANALQDETFTALDDQDSVSFQNNLIDEAVTLTEFADNIISTSTERAESVSANENNSNTKVAYDITLDDGVLWSNIGLWGGTTNRNSSFTPVTITPKTSGVVTRFSIGLDRIDNFNLATTTTGTLVIRQTNNSGAILCSQSYSFSEVSALNRGITNIDLDTPITVVAGSTYWIGLTSGADWGSAASFTTYYNNVASFGAYAFNWSTSNGLTAAGQDAYRIRLLSDIALDTALAGFTAASSIDETNTALDSINAISEQNLYADEIVAISDEQFGSFSAPVDRSEALASSDAYSTYLDAVANISESVTWVDQQQNTLVAVTQAAETASLVDLSVNSNVTVSNISEASSLTSSEAGVFTAVAYGQEAVSLTDYAANFAGIVTATSETISALEESFRGVSLFAQSDEAALLDELSESKFAVSTYFEETFSLTDAVTNYVSTFGSAIEQAAGEDSPSTTVDTFAVIKESRLVSESNVVKVNFSSLISEDVSLYDVLESSTAFYTVASEGILFIDSYGATYSVVVSVEEPVFALDSSSRQLILVVSGGSEITATIVANLYRAMALSGLVVGDISAEARLQLSKLVSGSAIASLDLNGRLIKITPMNLADVQANPTSAYTYVATVNSATEFGDVSMDVYTYNVDASIETLDGLGTAIVRIESVAYISVSMYTADISMTAEVVYADFGSASVNLAA